MWLGAAGKYNCEGSLWTANHIVTLLMEAMLCSGREYLREKMLLAPTRFLRLEKGRCSSTGETLPSPAPIVLLHLANCSSHLCMNRIRSILTCTIIWCVGSARSKYRQCLISTGDMHEREKPHNEWLSFSFLLLIKEVKFSGKWSPF